MMKNKSIFAKTKSSILLMMLTFFLTSFTNNDSNIILTNNSNNDFARLRFNEMSTSACLVSYPDETVTGSSSGTVWGSNPYTTDSTLSAAAVHAGLIGVGETAVIRRTVLGELNNFTGSSNNGITSSSYNSSWCAVQLSIVSKYESGLYGDVYNLSGSSQGSLIKSGVKVNEINYNWGSGSVLTGPIDNVFLRFSGEIYIPDVNSITFYTYSDDGIRFRINNSSWYSSWVDQGPTEHTFGFNSSSIKNSWVPFTLEYYERGGGAVAQFRWNVGGKVIVPSSNFRRLSTDITSSVIFNTVDGNSIASMSGNIGSIFELPTPTKTGYTFDSWYLNYNSGVYSDQVTTGVFSSTPRTLYAKWTPIQNTLSFNLEGGVVQSGSSAESRIINYDDQIGTLPVVAKTGYTFVGWSTAASPNTYINASTINKFTSSTQLIARWTAKTYALTLDPLPGTGSTSISGVVFNQAMPTIVAPTRVGYTFEGYYYQNPEDLTEKKYYSLSGTNAVSANNWDFDGTPTLYAKWTPIQNTLSFNLEGGVVQSGSSAESRIINYDDQIGTLPVVAKTGYTFVGWSTAASPNTYINASTINKFTSSTQLIARWTAKTYALTLDPLPGTGSTSISGVVFNQAMPTIVAPTRVGYTFEGYYYQNPEDLTEKKYYSLSGTNAVSANNWDFDGTPTLYAKWTPIQNTLSFIANGGTLTQNTTKTIVYDAPFGELPTPNFNGYRFLGWTRTLNGTDYINENDIVSLVSTIEVYAKWQASSYDVTFVSDNIETSNKEIVYRTNYGELPIIEKFGYSFSGWYSDTSYLNEITQNSIMEQFVNHSLFAKWTPVRSQVNFNVESVAGAVAPTPINVDYNSTYGTLPTLSKTGYNFTGWFTSLVGGQQISSNTTVSIVSPQTIYPRFSAKEFTLSFSLDGGTLTGPQSIPIAFDQNYNNLPTPIKAGYQFDGWHTLANNGTEVSSDSIFVLLENQTLFAYWTPEPYAITFDKNDPLATEPTLNQVVTDIIDVTFNEQYGELPLVSKLGYNFNGWYSAPIGGQQITSSSVNNIVGPHSLFAQFTPLSFNVTYNHNFTGSPSNVVIINIYDSTYLGMPILTRTGYDFVGWFTSSSDGTQVNVTDTVKILEDTTYFARWQIRKFTLTFDTKGGNIIVPITGDFASQVSILAPTREGHVFAGWSPSLPTTMPADNLNIEAIWHVENYSIALKINDGSDLNHDFINSNYGEALPINLDAPLREGFNFIGWYLEQTITDASIEFNLPTIMPDLGEDKAEITLFAGWNPIEYLINYFGSTEYEETNPTTYNLLSENIELTNNSVIPGYVFMGYYLNEDYQGNPVTSITPGSSGDLNLYAKFDKLPFNISFKDNLGNILKEEIVLFDDKIGESIIPKVEIPGFEFVKWNPSIPTTMPAEDLVLQAELKAIKYKLTIKDSLGNIIIEEELDYNQSLSQFEDNPKEIEGYEFLNWSKEMPETMPAKELIITGNYKKIPIYKLIILGTQDQIIAQYELRENQNLPNIVLPNLSNSPDFNFERWDGSLPRVMPGRDVTIKPIGTKKMNSISLYSKDRTLLDRIEAQVGSPLDIASPERIGYTFAGWSTSSEELIDISLMPVDPYDLFATWTAKVYTINVSVASLDYQIDIEFDKPIGQIVTPQLFGYRFDGWKNNLTDEFVNSNTIFTSPDQINLVPVFTRLNAAETLVATPGFIISLIARIFR